MSEHSAIRPQPGPQEAFLACPADIAIYGGAAYGGKSFALLLDPTRHVHLAGYEAVIFRRTTRQVKAAGGLWTNAEKLYMPIGGQPNQTNMVWTFPGGGRISFGHLEHEPSKYNWQGAQIAMIGFDELTQFTEGQFWYLTSRNRTDTAVKSYIRATCNPDPDSFVRTLIDWWIGPDGMPVPGRSGALRWFVRVNDDLVWADTPAELTALHPDKEPKSLTFIAATYHDNRIGLDADPGYIATLDALPKVERERLKTGNWDIRPVAGDYFRRDDFAVVGAAPPSTQRIRYWDRAATEPSAANPDPDWTVGLLLSVDERGTYTVEDVDRFRGRPGVVERRIMNTASRDGPNVWIGLEQDPGAAGKFEADAYARKLAGYRVKVLPPQGDKETRAGPVSSGSENGLVQLLRGAWNDDFLKELENFPHGAHDDQVDGLSGAFNALTGGLLPEPAGATVAPDAAGEVDGEPATYDPFRPQSMPDHRRMIRIHGGGLHTFTGAP